MERQDGRLEGRKEKDMFFVENMIRSLDLSDEKITSIAGVSLEFVAEVKARLNY